LALNDLLPAVAHASSADGHPSRYRIMRRAIAGLMIVFAMTASGAWLMHASIDLADESSSGATAVRHELLGSVKSWGFHVGALDVARTASSDLDLVVMDPEEVGRRDAHAASDALVQLKRKPSGGRRLVLAYLSIGQAESSRAYWDQRWSTALTRPTADTPHDPAVVAAPDWLAGEVPGASGAFQVRFWDERWQRLMFGGERSALERIVAAGFDGVVLGHAQAWKHWAEARRSAKADMSALIEAISSRARALSPGFIVVLQNSEELLADARVQAALDSVMKADLLHGIDGRPKARDDNRIRKSLKYLRLAQQSGLPVLVVEHLTDPAAIDAARSRIESLGFVPGFAPRALDGLGWSP